MVISAVGHETDFTVCDFVSDLRAPTPSAAAELVSPDIYEIMDSVINSFDYMENAVMNRIERLKLHLDTLTSEGRFNNPEKIFAEKIKELNILSEKMNLLINKKLSDRQHELSNICGKLDELSPLKTLSRG